MTTKRIFDCFIFYNELDILRIRLEELYNFVDYFVLCEATRNFRGDPKPLHFDMNKADFERFSDKIIHIIVDDLPPAASGKVGDFDPVVWGREHFQRNALRRGLSDAAPDDIIIISDCDEIVSSNTAQYLRGNSGYFLLDMAMYQFFLNMRALASGWNKPFAYTYALDKVVGDYNIIRTNQILCFRKFSGNSHVVKNAGWHFTFLGGATKVKEKLLAYSHTDGWQRNMWNDAVLADQMVSLREVGGAKILQFQHIDRTFPEFLRQNVLHFEAIGLAKPESVRLKELEGIWAAVDDRSRALVETHDQSLKRFRMLRRDARSKVLAPASLINIVPASRNFALGWSAGMQIDRARLETNVPQLSSDNLVMRHGRDAISLTVDTNVGYFTRMAVEATVVYTASCFVWLPSEFPGSGVALTLEFDNEVSTAADMKIRDRWQRIWTTGKAPAHIIGCNVVLRAYGTEEGTIYSTCWQLEDGGEPTEYEPTSFEH